MRRPCNQLPAGLPVARVERLVLEGCKAKVYQPDSTHQRFGYFSGSISACMWKTLGHLTAIKWGKVFWQAVISSCCGGRC